MSRSSPPRRTAPVIALAFVGAGCVVGASGPPPLSDDPGVIFSYPANGQVDVPVGARIVVSFTDPVDPAALAVPCTVDGAGRVAGGLCVRGPGGLVAATASITGPRDNVVHLEVAGWEPSTVYEVFASPALLWGAASNLVEGEPVLAFSTAQPTALAGQPPAVYAVNGDDPVAFGGGGAPRFPFLDFSTIRLTMTEPLDATSVTYGASVRLVDDAGALVDAALLVSGAHVTVDPVDDLTPGRTYTLELGAAGAELRDAGGEAAAPASLRFEPADSRVDGRELAQVLSCVPGNERSYAAGSVINRVSVASPLIGASDVAMRDSTLTAVMGNPSAFGPLIPLTLRKGQTLTMQALPVRLGGEIPTPLTTGDLRVQMASDATVYLVRNPFRDPARLPDDALAPVFAYLSFDVVITAADGTANAALNQHVLGVQATGLASVYQGGLAIESVGALELDLLGLDRATSNMVLRLRTVVGDGSGAVDATPPAITAASPADGARGVAADAALRVTFSEGLDAAAATRPGAVTLTAAGAPVPARVTIEGSTLVVTPARPLAYATDHALELGAALRDLGGVAFGGARLTFRTEDLATGSPMPLTLAAARPGVPCALEGASTATAGRCRAGDDDDEPYAPFTLPADQPVELHFHQPLDRSTVALGAACGTGSVRIERLGADGACAGAVPGRLIVGERAVVFWPDGGWEPGARYRVVARGGGDEDCDAGELCGVHGLPLNSDVLDGIADDDEAGGADVVLPFTAAEARTDRYYLTARTAPTADRNGNGYVDAGERAGDTNRAAMRIVSTSGMIRSATLRGADCVPGTPSHEACMYLDGTLPAAMGRLQHDCVIDGQAVDACIPIELPPQILYGTTLSMDAEVAVVGSLSDQRTEQLVLRMRGPGGGPVTSHIVVGADGLAELRARLELYLDAPSMRLLAGLAGHDLESKPLAVDVAGPVTFTDDGKIQLQLANVAAVPMSVRLDAIGIGIGTIAMEIPAGEMKLQLVGDVPAGVR